MKITDLSVKGLDAGRWWDTEIGGFGVNVSTHQNLLSLGR
jgi:hypothetical protein